jgi:hypothetical protein
MRRNAMNAALALAMALGLGACDDPSSSDTARVQLLLTDAPGDLASAEVTISEIYFQSADGRISLFEGSATHDLLDLQNGVTTELADVVIPAGSYSQLRLVVESATITSLDGNTYSTEDGTLACPSCAQSGFKVNMPGGSVSLEGDAQVLLIDFDVAQSFGHQAGGSGRWIMHPVMHATEFETTGGISGTVALDDGVALPETCGEAEVTLAHFVPTATSTADAAIVLSGVTDTAGDFSFPFVAPGTYTMGFAEIEFDNGEVLTFEATVDPETVTVGSGGAVASAAYLVTAATCEAASGE